MHCGLPKNLLVTNYLYDSVKKMDLNTAVHKAAFRIWNSLMVRGKGVLKHQSAKDLAQNQQLLAAKLSF